MRDHRIDRFLQEMGIDSSSSMESRAQLEICLFPLIRRVLQTGQGPRGLVRWLQKHRIAIGLFDCADMDRLAQRYGRVLSAELVLCSLHPTWDLKRRETNYR